MNPTSKTGVWLIVEVAIMLAMALIDAFKDHLQKITRKDYIKAGFPA